MQKARTTSPVRSVGLLALTVLPIIAVLIGETNGVRRCKYYGYNLAPHQDISHITDVPYVADCCKLCLANPSCQGFTHNRDQNCWLKSTNTPLVGDGKQDAWDTSSGIIEDVPDEVLSAEQVAQSRRTCEKLPPNTQIDSGHDIRYQAAVFTFEQCCELCKAHTACKAFVRNSHNRCWLKYNDGPTTPNFDPNWAMDSGIMRLQNPVLASPVNDCPFRHIRGPMRTEMNGYNVSPGKHLSVQPCRSFPHCALDCLRCKGCLAYVYDAKESICYLKDNKNLIASNDAHLHAGIFSID